MDCPYCHTEAERKWNYCPNCGHRLDRSANLFNVINEQVRQIRKLFGPEDFGVVQEPNKGITISISHGFGEPKISIRPTQPYAQKMHKEEIVKRRERKQPKSVVEPKADIKKTADSITVNVELPDVKSDEDIEIDRFPSSTEIRAYVGDKGYFKIVNIPQNYRMVDKKLEKGNLKLEFII